jgi:hypothetical protein
MNPSVSTYFRLQNSSCAPVASECGSSSGAFLRCTGRDSTAPLVEMESYDVTSHILAESCVLKGCDFFRSNNDGSGGTLYRLAATPGVDSYFRAPPSPFLPPPPGGLKWSAAVGYVHSSPALSHDELYPFRGV